MRNPIFRGLLPFLSAGLLSGCVTGNDNPQAGVDDFPNTVYASVSGYMNETQQAGASQIVPSSLQSLLQTGSLSASAKIAFSKRAAGKIAAGTVVWEYDTLQLLRDPVTHANIGIEYDSAWGTGIRFQGPTTRLKTFRVYDSGRIVSIEQSDADGDGNFTPVSTTSKSLMVIIDSHAGVTQRSELTWGPGTDTNFSTASDNVVYSAGWWKTSGTDTLVAVSYADGDGDGLVLDNARASVVLLDYRERNPSPGVSENHLWLKQRIHYNGTNDLMEFSGEQDFTNGRVTRSSLSNPEGGVNVDHRDTVLARSVTHGVAPDTLDSLVVEFRMTLGGTFDRQDDDRIQSFTLTEVHRKGEQSASKLQFTATIPFAPGTKPSSGQLSLEQDYTDKSSILLTGAMTGGVLSAAEVTNRKGRRFQVSWDAQGNRTNLKVL